MSASDILDWFAGRGVQVSLLRDQRTVWVDVVLTPVDYPCYGYAAGDSEQVALERAYRRYLDEHPEAITN